MSRVDDVAANTEKQGQQMEKHSAGKGKPCSPWLRMAAAVFVAIVLSSTAARAQYNSGSSGVHGAFPPAPVPAGARHLLWNLKTGLVRFCSAYDTIGRPDTCTTEVSTVQIPGMPPGGLTTGVFEFTSVDVIPNASVSVVEIFPVGYEGPTPLTILSQGAVRLRSGVLLHVQGASGTSTQSGLPPTGYGAPGGRPGPGGFAGGNGGKQGTPSTGGNPGFGPTGGAGGVANSGVPGQPATPTPVSTSLVPLVGGSGGGGGGGIDTGCGFRGAGGGGGGGGGALLIAANTQISLEYSQTTQIDAGGGVFGFGCLVNGNGRGGSGGAGSVRLVAPTITGAGGIAAPGGIVRIEGNASTYSGPISATRGTVLGAPQPSIPTSFPQLSITSVGGISVGANPTGAITTPDVTFQTAPTGPVVVALRASNVPIGTVVNVRANPLIGTATTANSSGLAGTEQDSTASASLQIPAGAGVITGTTSFPVTTPLLAMLPAIPGLMPANIELVANDRGPSRTFLVGVDARRVELMVGPDGRYAVAR